MINFLLSSSRKKDLPGTGIVKFTTDATLFRAHLGGSGGMEGIGNVGES